MATKLPIKNEIVTVDLSKTIGQESAIQANGSPIFTIKVTEPAFAIGDEVVPGFGRVVSDGPVRTYEVLYTAEALVR